MYFPYIISIIRKYTRCYLAFYNTQILKTDWFTAGDPKEKYARQIDSQRTVHSSYSRDDSYTCLKSAKIFQNLYCRLLQPVPGSQMVVESRSVIRNAKNVRPPFPSCACLIFCFARFKTFPLYYLRAWQRLRLLQQLVIKTTSPNSRKKVSNEFMIHWHTGNFASVLPGSACNCI